MSYVNLSDIDIIFCTFKYTGKKEDKWICCSQIDRIRFMMVLLMVSSIAKLTVINRMHSCINACFQLTSVGFSQATWIIIYLLSTEEYSSYINFLGTDWIEVLSTLCSIKGTPLPYDTHQSNVRIQSCQFVHYKFVIQILYMNVSITLLLFWFLYSILAKKLVKNMRVFNQLHRSTRDALRISLVERWSRLNNCQILTWALIV